MADPGFRACAADVEFELLVPAGIGSRFGFELAVVPRGDAYRAVLFHRRDRVGDGWAAEFLDRYVTLLGALAATPARALDRVRP
jgi:hypothetical protein